MNEAAPRLNVAIVEGIDKIPRDAWDNLLAPDDSPFVEWDWLRAMENSGSAARDTGWAPYHLIVRQGPKKQIVAACPLYLKTHSMGEFVFDHGWADAAERAGLRYFPKIVVGVPFTPHTGRRFLTAPGTDRGGLINLLGLALTSIGEDNKLSSVHVNFCEPDEAAALAPIGFMERLGYQYHWHNAGFTTFDDYLNRLKHKRRTAVRHERAAMDEQGVHIRVTAGEEIPDKTFADMYRIYCSTIEKLYWGRQYLTPDFFDLIRKTFKRNMVFIGAYAGRELVAGAVNLAKANVMYGRYWGCFREFRFLHFNVCYYAGIEHSILRGIQRYEPGAGGEYKWLRGFDPALTRSIHYVSNPDLKRAIAGFLKRERHEVERWIVAGKERSQLKPPPPSDQESE
ncbi:GNAT family N-acetyltransferase [Candidatus Binatus sp.]|uniref:GNAT family N-acetyltransferase n=1 Tax=Candidatus Binatus sp. TaxID=2811406 RepID=UPI003BB107DA